MTVPSVAYRMGLTARQIGQSGSQTQGTRPQPGFLRESGFLVPWLCATRLRTDLINDLFQSCPEGDETGHGDAPGVDFLAV